MKRLAALIVFGLLFTLTSGSAWAASPSFSQGFEADTGGWFDFGNGTVVRVPSGYTNGGGYADGIASAAGGFHARLQVDPANPSNPSCNPGSSDCVGPYTLYGTSGADSVFPEPGYFSEANIYLDIGWAATHPDYRFDWDSAINDSTGNFLQDFVFNVGTQPSGTAGFYVSSSTNAFRGSTFPQNPCPSPSDPPNACRPAALVTATGWYTFRHEFKDVGGFLDVRFVVRDPANTVVADWTIHSGHAISGVGGTSYGWFANQEIQDLAIDNTRAAVLNGPPATLTLSPPTATNTAGQQHCVTATVQDSFGNATPGIKVRFVVSGDNSRLPTSITTDANGQSQFCYTGTNAGSDTISAFADTNSNNTDDGASEPDSTASKSYLPAAPDELTLSPATATNTVGQQHCVTATVEDTYGNTTPGIKVVFSVSGDNSRAPSSVTTDGNGEAQFCYTGTNVGSDTIAAFADTNNNNADDGTSEPDSTASKTYTAASATTLVLSPDTATNTAGQQHCSTATVEDEFGNPVPNVSVVFTVSGANVKGPIVRMTHAAGTAPFCYTGTKAGTDTITAFADTDNNGVDDGASDPDDTATKIYKAAAPATLTLAPKTKTNKAGVQHCVTATVKDVYGNLVPAAKLVFTVTGANNRAPAVRMTNVSGKVMFCYTGTHVGTDTIGAFADNNGNGVDDGSSEPDNTATKIYKPTAPAKLILAPKSDTNPVGAQHCVTATNKDAYGNVTPGIVDRFSVTGSVTKSGSVNADANGKAKFCYTGPAVPGSDTITAYADTNRNNIRDAGEPLDTASKTWVPPSGTTPCQILATDGYMTTNAGDRADFNGSATETSSGADSGNEQYIDQGPANPMVVQSLNVQAITCSADKKQASIFGQATIDGTGTHNYRIDVQDLAEPSEGADTYRIRLDTGYDSGQHNLTGGNIQIK